MVVFLMVIGIILIVLGLFSVYVIMDEHWAEHSRKENEKQGE